MGKTLFERQADLLITILPHIDRDTDFALHGGTAINFFVRDMPRISVDIDLTFLPILGRDETLENISQKLEEISKSIISAIPSVTVERKRDVKDQLTIKLFIKKQGAIVKIEPNLIIRGAVFGCEPRDLCKKAEEVFERFVTINTLSFAQLYGSKICATLDRQHPRDMFDIMLLLQNEGITEDVRKAFIVYLISHNRTMAELLAPNLKDMRAVYDKELEGMSSLDVTYENIESAQRDLVKTINKDLTDNERMFLISFKKGNPKWELLGIDDVEKLPAVQWKLSNLKKMDQTKNKKAIDQLKRVMDKGGV